MKYRVVLLTVPYFECLRDIADMFALALQEAKLPAAVHLVAPKDYALENGTQDILLGVHTAPEIWDRVPPRTVLSTEDGFAGTPPPIVYQTENFLRGGQLDVPSWWRRLALRAVCWDYSAVNAKHLGAQHVPLGYVPAFVRPLPFKPFPDIDVLFYGSINERRKATLQRMRDLGLRVEVVFNCFGQQLEPLITRSKVILNVHFYDPGLFESSRVVPLIHQGACVLSEQSSGGEGGELCTTVPYADLAQAARELVHEDRYLVVRAEDHRRLRRQRPTSARLAQALGAGNGDRAKARPASSEDQSLAAAAR
jgi:hypothetical protein